MSRRQPPERGLAPVAARYRVHYAKRDRMRFASGRDFQRALERAIRRSGVPVAFSAGFSPHPRISYTNTVPTGAASEAEYFELGLTRAVACADLRQALAQALPEGFVVVAVVPAASPDFAERFEASQWRIELLGAAAEAVDDALGALLARPEVLVERLTKSGPKAVDVRAAVLDGRVVDATDPVIGVPCAILQVVVRHVVPSVRPVDVLAALQEATGLPLPQAPRICRLAQGPLGADGVTIGDPLARDRAAQHA
jgi:radical SAM-linked protein